ARDRAREEARQLLLEARQEVEAAIQDVRSAGDESSGGGETLDEVSRKARRRVEDAARRLHDREPSSRRSPPGRNFATGDRVSLEGSGSEGKVVELREDRAVVETAGVRFQVPLGDLVFRGPPTDPGSHRSPASAGAASSWQGPEAEANPELDLRGMRVTEIGLEVDRALDQAVLAGLNEICIIHGKGTGALRERVVELLTGDGRVGEYRMGLPAEGGAGVTIVSLR
ncbi:Smr/MutS family protein, partial [Gemmatimonadota bacterium]